MPDSGRHAETRAPISRATRTTPGEVGAGEQAVKKNPLMRWVDEQVESKLGLASEVDRLLTEMRIEQELVALREKRGLSQREAARLIHVSQPYVARLESGRIRNVGVGTLAKYAHALGGRLTIDIRAAPDGVLRSWSRGRPIRGRRAGSRVTAARRRHPR
jgi:transcriptional regulator with XRE-family HTH domain